MTAIYTDADFLAAYKQKQRIWRAFICSLALYLVFCIAWEIYYVTLPYNDPMQALPKWSVYVVSAIYACILYPVLAIKYGRVRRYYRMLSYVSTGLKNEETNYFYCFDKKDLQKDYVDVIACVFETWSKKKSEWLEREAYFDPEKPLPPFESGDLVKYVVQSNFVVQYEILEKKALEFEEVEDELEEGESDELVEEERIEDKTE